MALSRQALEEAYKVFNELKLNMPDLKIGSWPIDTFEWNIADWDEASMNSVYGSGTTADGGWESIFLVTKNPSPEFIQQFNDLKGRVPNSSMDGRLRGTDIYYFGWF